MKEINHDCFVEIIIPSVRWLGLAVGRNQWEALVLSAKGSKFGYKLCYNNVCCFTVVRYARLLSIGEVEDFKKIKSNQSLVTLKSLF